MLGVSEYVNTGYLKNYPPPLSCEFFPTHTEMVDDNSQYNGIKVNFLLFSVTLYMLIQGVVKDIIKLYTDTCIMFI